MINLNQGNAKMNVNVGRNFESNSLITDDLLDQGQLDSLKLYLFALEFYDKAFDSLDEWAYGKPVSTEEGYNLIDLSLDYFEKEMDDIQTTIDTFFTEDHQNQAKLALEKDKILESIPPYFEKRPKVFSLWAYLRGANPEQRDHMATPFRPKERTIRINSFKEELKYNFVLWEKTELNSVIPVVSGANVYNHTKRLPVREVGLKLGDEIEYFVYGPNPTYSTHPAKLFREEE